MRWFERGTTLGSDQFPLAGMVLQPQDIVRSALFSLLLQYRMVIMRLLSSPTPWYCWAHDQKSFDPQCAIAIPYSTHPRLPSISRCRPGYSHKGLSEEGSTRYALHSHKTLIVNEVRDDGRSLWREEDICGAESSSRPRIQVTMPNTRQPRQGSSTC